MKKQVLIIGLGRFGVGLANTLLTMGYDVLAIDVDEKNVQAVAHQIPRAVQADATDESVLRELGADKFDVAIVAMGSDIENSVLSTILLRKLGRLLMGKQFCCMLQVIPGELPEHLPVVMFDDSTFIREVHSLTWWILHQEFDAAIQT